MPPTTPRQVRTTLARLGIALLAGTAATLAIAWLAATTLHPNDIRSVSEAEQACVRGDHWYVSRVFVLAGKFGLMRRAFRFSNAQWVDYGKVDPRQKPPRPPNLQTPGDPADLLPLGTRRWVMPWTDEASPAYGHLANERHLYAYGWPWQALAQLRGFADPLNNSSYQVVQEGCIAAPRWLFANSTPPGWSSMTFPVRILWAGALADIALFAAAWLAAGAAIRKLRTTMRLRAGRCPSCGYALRGLAASAACPECGWLKP